MICVPKQHKCPLLFCCHMFLLRIVLHQISNIKWHILLYLVGVSKECLYFLGYAGLLFYLLICIQQALHSLKNFHLLEWHQNTLITGVLCVGAHCTTHVQSNFYSILYWFLCPWLIPNTSHTSSSQTCWISVSKQPKINPYTMHQTPCHLLKPRKYGILKFTDTSRYVGTSGAAFK